MVELNERQEKILLIVKEMGPITGENIAEMLNLTRATLRPDLAVLSMAGYLEAKPRVGYTYKPHGDNPFRKTLNQFRTRDILSVAVVLKDSSSVYDAIVTLFMEDTGSVVIVGEDGNLSGIVSRKDLLKAALGQGDMQNIPVSVIMTRMPNVITISPDEPVSEAVRKLVEHEIDCLPVVKCFINEDNSERCEVVGRVTKTNIARVLLELVNK